MNFEDLLMEIGEFDAYQWQVLLIICLISLVPSESAAINFIAWPVKHWCQSNELQHLHPDVQRSLVGPVDDITGEPSQCVMWNINFTQALENIQRTTNISTWTNYNASEEDYLSGRTVQLDNETLQLWKHEVSNASWTSCNSWIYDVSSSSRSIRSSWDLVCHREWLVDVSSTCIMAGLLVGSLVSGRVSDQLGRLKAIWFFQLIKTVGSLIAALAPNIWVFLVGRFVLAFGGMANHLARFVLLMEILGTKSRATVALLYNLSGIVSTGSLVLIAYFVPNYIQLQLISTIPLVLHFAAYPFLYESPRWLLVKDRHGEAEQIIQRISRINKKPLPAGLDISQIDVGNNKGDARLRDLLNYPVLRKRALIISFHWLADSLLYYALLFNIGSLPGSTYVNMLIITLLDFPTILICYIFLRWRWTGRRLTCAFLLIITGIIGMTEVPLTLLDYKLALTVLSLITYMIISASFTSIYIYSAELYPTQARNTGMGFSSTCARVGSLVAPFVGPWMASYWKPLPSMVFAVIGSASGSLTMLLPETLGQKLPETLYDAEHFKTRPLNVPLKIYAKANGESKGIHSAPLLDTQDTDDADDEEYDEQDVVFRNVAFSNELSSDEI